MSLRPGAPDVHFSRLMTRLRVSFRINETGGVASGVTLFTHLPETSGQPNCTFDGGRESEVGHREGTGMGFWRWHADNPHRSLLEHRQG